VHILNPSLTLQIMFAPMTDQFCIDSYITIFCTFRSYRSNRTSLFDGIEEGGIRATSYSSHEIDEQENDRAIDGLQDRVSILKRVLCHLILMF
jgi:blocked early in transport 1